MTREEGHEMEARAERGDVAAAAILNEPFRFDTRSPIEATLLDAFLEVVPERWIPEVYEDPRDCFVRVGDVERQLWFRVETQYRVGRYVVDVVLSSVMLSATPIPRRDVRIVVECDGHDFHERTREQAQRDKARDRFLQAAGFRVLRFTGSEIWADAGAVARELVQVIEAIAVEN